MKATNLNAYLGRSAANFRRSATATAGLALAAVLILSPACSTARARQSAQAGQAVLLALPASATAIEGSSSTSPAPDGQEPESAGVIAAQDATPPTPPGDAGPAKPVYRGRADANAVALTFDAGADAGYAALILDTLERNGIRASFGMTGQWAEAHPELVRRMAADGDQLMNHTWDHRSLTGLSTSTRALTHDERSSELARTEETLLRLTGKSTLPYFRAPFGDQDASVDRDAGLLGYRYDVLWSVDTGGWAGAPVSRIVATSSRGAVPGAIIVMHVGAASQDGPALQGVIDAVQERGLGFATVADLVGVP